MVNKISTFLVLFIFIVINLHSIAQERNYLLNGKVIDHKIGFPIPYATVKEIIKDSSTVLNITVTNEAGVNAFWIACRVGHGNIMEILAKHDIDIMISNKQGLNVLHLAVV